MFAVVATIFLSSPPAHQLDTSIHVTGACQFALYWATAQKRNTSTQSLPVKLPAAKKMWRVYERVFMRCSSSATKQV